MHLIFLVTLCAISLFIHLQQIESENKRKYEVVFLGVTLFLFAALRAPSVGVDVQRYCDAYKTVGGLSYEEILDPNGRYALRDPVFHCFIRTLAYVSENPQIMLAVIGAWVAFSFSYFVYHTRGHVLNTFLLFICLRIYSFTLTGLRQAIAMGFIWIAFVFLQKNKKIRYLVFVLIASLFHASAIAFLMALPLMMIKNNKLVLGVALFVTAANYLSGNRIVNFLTSILFPNRFKGYIETAMGTETNLSSTFLLYIVMFLFILFFLQKVKAEDAQAAGIFNVVCFGLMISFIAQGFPNMFRVAYYFICNLFPLFTQAVAVSSKQSERILINAMLPVLLIAQYLLLGTSGGTENYTFFWET